ncbi:phosphoribosyltransferase family protein [Arthrobacter sp. EH-1B-1]|uniref:Phosphoribosyltransferase family protein n=1 Tax=Arthrobacter vasquezii TaxID=2977629 RepID=A0ABT6D1N4_9MICC|nr:phosphoribosyltransferase family protein [Arthrobacter vasquezii]MDF9279585.1 phosphoribosyltransferase family protein [Arthrobacter vasquezii]
MKQAHEEPHRYADRADAGRQLAIAVHPIAAQLNPVVLALPRGGVPVAVCVAEALGAPLDVVMVRKVGVPECPELAMGAVASIGGAMETVRNAKVLADVRNADAVFARVAEREQEELVRRERLYREGLGPLEVSGATVVIIDDGVATGATMLAAVAALRKAGAGRIIAAAPVFLGPAAGTVQASVDELVNLWSARDLPAVGSAYRSFDQVPDAEVRRLLRDVRGRSLGTMTDYSDLPESYRAYLAGLDDSTAAALMPVLKQSVAGGEHGVLITTGLGPDTQAEVSSEVPFGEVRETVR